MQRRLQTAKTVEGVHLCGAGQEEGGADKGSKAGEDERKQLLCKQNVVERLGALNAPLLQYYLNPPPPDENRQNGKTGLCP